MTTQHRRYIVTIAVAMSLALAPTLTGCFGGNPIEGIIENATGGDVDLGGTSVPDDFPSEVPLYDGEVVFGAGIGFEGEKAWNVSVRLPDATAIDAIAADLESAGFETQVQTDPSAEGGTVISEGTNFGVLVVVVKDDAGFIANYTVTTKSAG